MVLSNNPPTPDDQSNITAEQAAQRIDRARKDLQFFSGSEGYANFRNYIDETEKLSKLLPATSAAVRERLAHLDMQLGEALGDAFTF